MAESVLPPDLLSAQGQPEQTFESLLKTLQDESSRPLLRSPQHLLAAGLAGAASGYRGQPNPVLERARADRDASLRQTIQMADLRLRVQSQQRAKDQALLGIAQSLLPLGGVPAQTGAKIIGEFLGKSGYRIPGLEVGLAQGTYSLKTLENIQAAKARGLPLDYVQTANPMVPPQVIKSIYDTPLSDDARKALKLPTTIEQNKAALDLKLANLTALEKDLATQSKARELAFPEIYLDKKLGSRILSQHLKNTQSPSQPGGIEYQDGTPATKAKAREEARIAHDTEIITKAAALAGVRAGEQIVKAPVGGTIWDRTDRRDVSYYKHTDAQLDPTRYVNLSANQRENRGLIRRAMLQNARLKQLTPLVLAATPGKNILRALELGAARLTGSNPMLREWVSLVADTKIENARVLSGAGQLRVLIIKIIGKDIGPLKYDTVRTALTAIDTQTLTMENYLRNLHNDPLLAHDRRIGPGTYWAIDRETNQRVPIVIKEHKISPERYMILEVR